MQMPAVVCSVLVALAVPALAQSTVDGDTIKVGGTTYRLWGIDSPETRQQCSDGWPAGIEATKAISELVRGKAIDCEARGHDRYGRTIGLCRAGGRDLGQSMVRAGMALAFTRYSDDYVADEIEAKAALLGMHGHSGCAAPWEWRAQQRRP